MGEYSIVVVHFNKCVFHIYVPHAAVSNYYQIRMLAKTAVAAVLLPNVPAVRQSWCHQEDLLLCFADATDNAAPPPATDESNTCNSSFC